VLHISWRTCVAHQSSDDTELTSLAIRWRRPSARQARLVVGELKTARSRRTLFLTPQLVELLRRHRARLAEERIAVGEASQDHGLIFPSELGTPPDPDSVSHVFSRICRRAGRGHWHLHELRHSGASLMLARGTELYVVSEVLGHSSVAITKDVYGHLVEGQKRAAAQTHVDSSAAGEWLPRDLWKRRCRRDGLQLRLWLGVWLAHSESTRTPNLLIRRPRPDLQGSP
jgi:hypothetical protein